MHGGCGTRFCGAVCHVWVVMVGGFLIDRNEVRASFRRAIRFVEVFEASYMCLLI